MFRKRQQDATAGLVYADAGTTAKPRTKNKRRLAAGLIALAVTLGVIGAAAAVGISLNNREQRYTAAKDMAADKQYDQALEAFEALGDYRDSRALALELEAKQTAYEAARELLQQQRYEEAAAAFRALGGYADSAQQAAYQVNYQKALDLLTEIDVGKTQLLTRILSDQVKLTDERSYPAIVGYETAAALLKSLGDYRSAPALVDRCYYSAGLVKLSWSDWEGALAYMEKMTAETAAEFLEEYQQRRAAAEQPS